MNLSIIGGTETWRRDIEGRLSPEKWEVIRSVNEWPLGVWPRSDVLILHSTCTTGGHQLRCPTIVCGPAARILPDEFPPHIPVYFVEAQNYPGLLSCLASARLDASSSSRHAV